MLMPVMVPLGVLSNPGVGIAAMKAFFGPGLAVSSRFSVSLPLPRTSSEPWRLSAMPPMVVWRLPKFIAFAPAPVSNTTCEPGVVTCTLKVSLSPSPWSSTLGATMPEKIFTVTPVPMSGSLEPVWPGTRSAKSP